jgi:hypothetical protein
MSRTSALARGQAAAEVGMVDACTIRRQTGTTSDDFSGTDTPVWASVYSGKCRVQQGIAQAAEQDAGEDFQLELRLIVQLPIAAVGFEISDEVTITVSQDPDLVGRVFLVRDLFHKTDATARRLGVTERTD